MGNCGNFIGQLVACADEKLNATCCGQTCTAAKNAKHGDLSIGRGHRAAEPQGH